MLRIALAFPWLSHRCTAGAGRDVRVPGDGWPSHIGACGSHRSSPGGWAGMSVSGDPAAHMPCTCASLGGFPSFVFGEAEKGPNSLDF